MLPYHFQFHLYNHPTEMYDDFLVVRMANSLQNFFEVNQRLLRRWDFCCIFYFLPEHPLKFVLIFPRVMPLFAQELFSTYAFLVIWKEKSTAGCSRHVTRCSLDLQLEMVKRYQ